MPNDEFRIGGDGKAYPRLLVKKIPSSAFPWKVQKLYAQGPFAKKDLLHEGTTAKAAYDEAGRILDEALAAEANKVKMPRALPLTFDDLNRTITRHPLPTQVSESWMGS